MKFLRLIACSFGICLTFLAPVCLAQSVSSTELYYNLDSTSAGEDYETSGGGYLVLKFSGANIGSTAFSVIVTDNGNSTVSTISVGQQGTSIQTFAVSKHGATITVSTIPTTIGVFTVGAPSVDSSYCVGASDASGVEAYFSSQRVPSTPDDPNHKIHHYCHTAPFFNTVKMIPNADGHIFYTTTYITTTTSSGNNLVVDEQFSAPTWNAASEYWVDAP